MKNILLLPLLRMSSGHHQVADALIAALTAQDSETVCEKADILHYSSRFLESLAASCYIRWIRYAPQTYSWLYHRSVYQKQVNFSKLYETLFLKCMLRLINEKRPDLVICTHALPSFLMSRLKQSGLTDVPVINAYTDFFINGIWGLQWIDYHFVPHPQAGSWLVRQGVDESRIFVTGIPVHPLMKSRREHTERKRPGIWSILITGGNLGVGGIESWVNVTEVSGKIHFHVLCGKNEKLYRKLRKIGHPYITPHPYIASREEMSRLYDRMDGVITKPGGVTISECLHKKVPIFIDRALPGQEEINLRYLLQQKLVVPLPSTASKEQELLAWLEAEENFSALLMRMEQYQASLKDHDLEKLLARIMNNCKR
jgi:UDP-N-acetylglucosamine:LPS N-acetylglucosamine transferase